MDKMPLEELREAGKITKKIIGQLEGLVIVGASYRDVAETIEEMIVEEGAKPAFPVNISVNEAAAHDTPDRDDERVFTDNDLVKIDFGVWLNNAFTDVARTIDLSGKYADLVSTAEKALENAVKAIKPGVKVGDIGGIIENTIKKEGLKPIVNLTGHKMEPLMLHAGIEIPNIKTSDPYEFEAGDVFAIEPFVTTGDAKGYVKETEDVRIFSLIYPKQPRMRHSRKLLSFIVENYLSMPFAERWLHKAIDSKLMLHSAIKELLKMKVLEAYPVLVEASGKPVAQMETNVVVTEKGCERIV